MNADAESQRGGVGRRMRVAGSEADSGRRPPSRLRPLQRRRHLTGRSGSTRDSTRGSVRGSARGAGPRSSPAAGRPQAPFSRFLAAATYVGRWPIVAAWLLVCAFCLLTPAPAPTADETAALIPANSPAIRAEIRSVEIFGYPLSSRTSIVQHDPAGMDPFVQAESVLDAVGTVQNRQPWPLLGALPYPNAVRLTPTGPEQGTAVLTYLFMDPISSFGDQQAAAQRYIDRYLDRDVDRVVGVAGSVPARAEQARILTDHLHRVEILTLLAIFVLVGVAFRSLVVPLLALGASGVAVVVTLRLAAVAAAQVGVSAPAELQPLLVALLLGVVTDYTIFYVTGYATALAEGGGRRATVRRAVLSHTHIVLAAGFTVAAGTLTMMVAETPFYRAFGPSMAITILIGLSVSITLIPALLAILGPRIFWPRRVAGQALTRERDPRQDAEPRADADAGAGAASARDAAVRRTLLEATGGGDARRRPGTRLTRILVSRPGAVTALVITTLLLGLATTALTNLSLGAKFTASLPADNPVVRASSAAAQAYAPGITSPTTLLLEAPGVGRDLGALVRLQQQIEKQQGVAAVIGPAQIPSGTPTGVMVSRDGDAARMLVVFDSDPLGARAITSMAQLRTALPALSGAAGLGEVTAAFAGDTPLAEGLVRDTTGDLGRIAIASVAVNLLILMVFLRAVIAPLYLMAANVLTLGAALGLTTWVFQTVRGEDGITFYIPFAAAVLLVSLGSDYTIFGAGRVWEEARRLPLREAILRAMPETSRAITTAGIVLAVSFGMLGSIPLAAFRELAFAMAVGILLDTFVARSVLMPALIALVGRVSAWPGRLAQEPTATN